MSVAVSSRESAAGRLLCSENGTPAGFVATTIGHRTADGGKRIPISGFTNDASHAGQNFKSVPPGVKDIDVRVWADNPFNKRGADDHFAGTPIDSLPT